MRLQLIPWPAIITAQAGTEGAKCCRALACTECHPLLESSTSSSPRKSWRTALLHYSRRPMHLAQACACMSTCEAQVPEGLLPTVTFSLMQLRRQGYNGTAMNSQSAFVWLSAQDSIVQDVQACSAGEAIKCHRNPRQATSRRQEA